MRQTRKLEHIRWALDLPDGPLSAGFEDIRLVHNALPELDQAEVNSQVEVFGCTLEAPMLINAITGGNREVLEINRNLAKAAWLSGLGMAVGSQTAGILEPELGVTYKVVREENPTGLIIANLGANSEVHLAQQAVEMINANALQLHLNVAQELVMGEGDRNFRGILENIGKIAAAVSVPVIVKEVGFGISRETALKLGQQGISWIDIGGAGGTNFAAIEHRRGKKTVIPEDWGITTAASLAEVITCPGVTVIASGGIRTPLEVVKALALGASLAGIAGPWLKTLMQESLQALLAQLEVFKRDLRMLMLLAGAPSVGDLKQVPLVITGFTADWLRERGVDTQPWAQRI